MSAIPAAIRRFAVSVRCAVATIAVVATGSALAAIAPAEKATGPGPLRTSYETLKPKLDKNDFGRPIHLDSVEQGHDLKGEIHAVMDHPFAKAEGALYQAANWCEILILPHNTKYCAVGEGGKSLTLWVGRKNSTPVEDCYRLDFNWQLVSRTRDYLHVVLTSANGPLGTRDYRISLEATPLENRTLLHLSYNYSYGTISRLAMQTYLATMGASKVGFTVESRDDAGNPQFVKGMRGVMERNTMRYFLAIDAYLNSLNAPVEARLEKRLNDWFTANERYPRQLRESDRGEYVAMKQKDYQRLKVAG